MRGEIVEAAVLCITVVYSPAPRVLHEMMLTLPAGSRLSDALSACALDERFAAVSNAPAFGLWGKHVAPGFKLTDQDRVEIYRSLRVDPKVARRERFKKQGAKSAGLFAKRRQGAKAGY